MGEEGKWGWGALDQHVHGLPFLPFCHKSLPSPLKVRLRWLLADLQASPDRHMSFYQPRPRWHCSVRVLTPSVMRRRKEGRGGKKKG